MPTCQCGCGEPVSRAKLTDARRGIKRGDYHRFSGPGHYQRTKYDGSSYKAVTVARGRNQMIHRIRAENALGRPLPKGVEVHHADGSRDPYGPLVICPNHQYHRLLHARMRVIKFGGNPNTDKICYRCKTAKNIADFPRHRGTPDGLANRCKACACILASIQRANARAGL